jgi:hypothetical protein
MFSHKGQSGIEQIQLRNLRFTYPFVPKSTAYLEPGTFWSIPLDNGRFACGRVIQLLVRHRRRDSRIFLAGLIDWVGSSLPTSESIAGRKVLEQGSVHVKTIRECDGLVLGHRSLELDGIEPALMLDQSPGKGCRVQKGFELLGRATKKQQETLPVYGGWGFRVIKGYAEDHFGDESIIES